MIRKYKIKSIVHSGRKGERGTPVTQEKYAFMIGCEALFDLEYVRIGRSFSFLLVGHPLYYDWTMSCVTDCWFSEETKTLNIETANSIYEFEYIGKWVDDENKEECNE